MAKSKFESHVKPRFNEIKQWLLAGASDEEVYKNLGISKNTFYQYLNKYSDFKDLVKKNRINPVQQIKAALFKKAIGFDYQEQRITETYLDLTNEQKEVLSECGFNAKEFGKIKTIRKETFKRKALPDAASCMILLKHWAKDEGWTNDPQSLEIRKQELEIKKENNDW